jgi:CRISPR-associated endonuclease Cas2
LYKFGVVVAYDCEDDKLRYKITRICKDYGLVRVQFSVFLGTFDMFSLKEFKEHITSLPKDQNFNVFIQKVPLESTNEYFAVSCGKYKKIYDKKMSVV